MTAFTSVDSVLRDAQGFSQLGRFNEAEQLYSMALNQLGSHVESSYTNLKQLLARIYNDRGQCRYKQVHFDEAVEDYTKAISLDPTLAAAYYNKGTIHYRLCAARSQGTGERQALVQQAVEDFKEAVRLASDNQEFQEGLRNCKDMNQEIQGGGKCTPKKRTHPGDIAWSSIPSDKLVKLLFLMDNGDKTSGATEKIREENIIAASEAMNALLSVLTDKDFSFKEVLVLLQGRVKVLAEYAFIMLPRDTKAADRALRKSDEDLLTLVEACQYLDIEFHKLDDKVKKVQEKLLITDEEMQGTFFIYAENLRMCKICDSLSPSLVCRMLEIMKDDKDLNKLFRNDLNISMEKVCTTEGLKEALFFYMIRLLEVHDKLNRVYTDNLESLLERLSEVVPSEEERCKVVRLADFLNIYPGECRPPGLCIVFCVTKDRPGAEGEINKVGKVFRESLGYTVEIVKNPNEATLKEWEMKLEKQKYRFYDSVVYWFMSHGTGEDIVLADGEGYNRDLAINNFSKILNFRKKPKIFFMASCRGKGAIPVECERGMTVAADGKNEGTSPFSEIPDSCIDITVVYYEMDRLIANSTLPDQSSFRLDKGDESSGGSLYVDIVCQMLKKHRGKSITEVLERVCNKMHQILFNCKDLVEGEVKQACNFESTLQKTFLVPSSSSP